MSLGLRPGSPVCITVSGRPTMPAGNPITDPWSISSSEVVFGKQANLVQHNGMTCSSIHQTRPVHPSLNWTALYNTINAANLALKYIPQIDFFDQNKASTFLADAYFVRAFCYFTLVRVWGDVPVSVRPYESYDDDNLLPGRTPKEQVYNLIKEDIEFALSNMADNTPRNRVMANKAAINMLKTEVYLWTAKREGGGRADLDLAFAAVEECCGKS
jgi:hypothetical protein